MSCHFKHSTLAPNGSNRTVAHLAYTLWLSSLLLVGAQQEPFNGPTAEDKPSPAAALTQAEVIRRQELVFRATQSIAEGEKAEANGDTAKALDRYQFALDNLTNTDNAAAERARQAVVRISMMHYEEAKKKGDTALAVKSLQNAVRYDPQNQEAKDLLADIQKVQKQPGKTKTLGNPAVTTEHVANVQAVDQLLIEAEQFRRTGQYNEAEADYRKILAIDKYNQKALAGLQSLTAEKNRYAQVARDQTRAERLRQVEEKWTPALKHTNLSKTIQVAATPFTRSNQFAIDQKLKTMVIKDLAFTDASIEDAAGALAAKSKELDTDSAKLGISFIVKPEALSSARSISLNLRNIPMEDALRYITKLADVKYKVEEFAVVIVPLKESTEVLLRRQFNVAPNFFPAPSIISNDNVGGGGRPPQIVGGSGGAESNNNDVKTLLEDRGVDFKTPGSSAVYYPGSGVLTVTNTQEQLDLIEELVNAGATPTYMIDVQTKLVEIAQTDLNELTSNAALWPPGNFLNPIGNNPLGSVPTDLAGVPSGQVATTTALRGSQGFNVSGIDSLLHGNSSAQPSLFNISGQIGAQAFSVVLTALSQKRSFDLLSAPSLRVKNGEDATINVSRTFYYPTAFDPAESAAIQTVSQGSGINVGPPIVIPTFPTEFESRDIGVKMKVRPQLGADNKTVDLALFPEVTDFEGFVNYGSPIFVAGGTTISGVDGTNAFLLSNNVVNQPVFNTRRIDTKIFVRDGYTVVLGGLIRDDVQTVTDKVPFLGDLPLVGRLFQSKATQSQKRNLLIFVTCRIYLNNGELLNPPGPSTPAGAAISASVQ